ncbi:hypothetical protein LUZ16_29180 [Streptomyces albireticuli]|uniref:hypothetical protein n=1 Tax=Streptomyces albireticuli TaxID=1940 RepID=UPI001E613825|nr:hypothetical protein [Streptomyces albireticuli]MCD9146061.1 hypothetical protein [Streptomyces albireticuli]
MPFTINAHQLGRLIDRTRAHVGGEFTEVLYGIRLEADANYVYAVASDRYTVGAARYRHTGLDGEPFARTLPARSLHALREWISTQTGHEPVTVTAAGDRVRFTAAHGDLGIAVSPDLAFFDWRGILRGVLEQTSASDGAFPVLDSGLLRRLGDADDLVRVRVTADRRAVLVVGEDFLGAQMPAYIRRRGIETSGHAALDQVHADWQHTLSAGAAAAIPDGIPAAPDRTRYEVTKAVTETAGDLLQQTLRSTHAMLESAASGEAFAAHAAVGATAWRAYRYLDALHTADPRLAATIVAETAEELDSGEIGEFAWEAAEKAGHDPDAWNAAFEARLAKARTDTGGRPGHEPAA